MTEDIIKEYKPNMEKVIESFFQDIKSVHSGRASSAIVEDLVIDHYNSKMPLKQLASITVPSANLIMISPWDKGALNPIETAIRESDLNLNPNNDGSAIRLTLPPMSEERRKELVKVAHTKAEEARISIRNIREDAWKKVQTEQKQGDITEDDKYRGQEKLNDLVKEFNSKIEEIIITKEKELLSI